MSKAIEAWRAWVAEETNSPLYGIDSGWGGDWCIFCGKESMTEHLEDHKADCPYRLMREELAAEETR